MLSCQKCGYDNELGRIFCHSCGTKLDLSQIKPPGQGGKKLRKRGGASSGKILRRTLDAVVLVGIGVVIYLLAQVPDVKVPKPTEQEKQGADTKVADLEQLLASQQAVALQVTPGEFNAYLGATSFVRKKGEGIGVSPLSLSGEFEKGTVKLVFLGEFTLGPISKKIYVTYTGKPVADGKQFVFKPTAGQIGAMPISPSVMETTGLVKSWFGGMFGGLDREKALLDKVSSIKVTPERALLIHQSAK